MITEEQIRNLNKNLLKIVVFKFIFGFSEPKIGMKEFKHLIGCTTHLKKDMWWEVAKELEKRGIIEIPRNFKFVKVNLPYQTYRALLNLRKMAGYSNQHIFCNSHGLLRQKKSKSK